MNFAAAAGRRGIEALDDARDHEQTDHARQEGERFPASRLQSRQARAATRRQDRGAEPEPGASCQADGGEFHEAVREDEGENDPQQPLVGVKPQNRPQVHAVEDQQQHGQRSRQHPAREGQQGNLNVVGDEARGGQRHERSRDVDVFGVDVSPRVDSARSSMADEVM